MDFLLCPKTNRTDGPTIQIYFYIKKLDEINMY